MAASRYASIGAIYDHVGPRSQPRRSAAQACRNHWQAAVTSS